MNTEAKDMLEYVIIPVNRALYPNDGPNADKLVVITGEMESNFDNLRQRNPGDPHAIGAFGNEKPTYEFQIKDLNKTENKLLKQRLLAVCLLDFLPPWETQAWNLRFAAAMCRLRYKVYKEPIPNVDDFEGMGRYYLKYYNGGGKGTMERYRDVCKQFF